MALTNDDLAKIRKVIREEVKSEVRDSTQTLGSQVRMTKLEIRRDINELDDRLKNVEIREDNNSDGIKKIHADVIHIKKTLDTVIKNYDEGDVKLDKRVLKIEEHLNLGSKN